MKLTQRQKRILKHRCRNMIIDLIRFAVYSAIFVGLLYALASKLMDSWENYIQEHNISTVKASEAVWMTSDYHSMAVTEKEPVSVSIAAVAMQLAPGDEYILAKIAMAEAEGEDSEGKALVIRTVLNRVADSEFPDSIEDVVFDAGAFTSTRNGRYDRVEPDYDCYEALAMVECGWDESSGALYFERTPVNGTTWHSRNLKKLFTHGEHTFYTEERGDTE